MNELFIVDYRLVSGDNESVFHFKALSESQVQSQKAKYNALSSGSSGEFFSVKRMDI